MEVQRKAQQTNELPNWFLELIPILPRPEGQPEFPAPTQRLKLHGLGSFLVCYSREAVGKGNVTHTCPDPLLQEV